MIINAVTGGGDLKLKVEGGAIRPTRPKENTIWVYTTTDITGYILSPTQPETGTEGLVWIKTADTGAEINVGRKNAVMLRLASGMLYSGGTWQMVDESCVYVSGAWIKLDQAVYMIKDGVLQATFDATNKASITQATGYVQFKGTTTGYFAAWADNIDLTNKSTISLEGTFDTSGDGVQYYLAIWDPKTSNKSHSNAIAKESYKNKSTAVLDVTSYTGAYSVGLTSIYTRIQKITSLKIE